MKSFEISLDEISLNMGDIFLGLGYGDSQPDGGVIEMVDSELKHVKALCRPRFGYRIMAVDTLNERSVCCGGVTIRTGAIITPYFRGAESLTVFVATAGAEFENYLHSTKASGDIMREFIVDTIGSEIAEATARLLTSTLAADMAAMGLEISNSYSPGYCGWNVSEQQNLFSLLPAHPCGIALSASSLMSPIKSVSGLIAVGPVIAKMPYGCDICGKSDCYKKRSAASTPNYDDNNV